MKILGIDFGTKNVGISISDDEGRVAFLRVTQKRDEHIVSYIVDMREKEGVETVVLGMPQNIPERWKEDIEEFKKELEQKGLKVVFQDESFSSHEAHHSAHQFGIKTVTDSSAAAIILQRYLDRESNKA